MQSALLSGTGSDLLTTCTTAGGTIGDLQGGGIGDLSGGGDAAPQGVPM